VPKSGKEMVRLFESSGWRMLRQRGSHVVMGKGTLRSVIPLHRELKRGLEQKLLKMILQGSKT
jgi:predicted RNA binding protein YcfA (HicA-like mRNA interferase family)